MQATQAPVCTISGVHDWPISKVKNAPNESRAACSVQRAYNFQFSSSSAESQSMGTFIHPPYRCTLTTLPLSLVNQPKTKCPTKSRFCGFCGFCALHFPNLFPPLDFSPLRWNPDRCLSHPHFSHSVSRYLHPTRHIAVKLASDTSLCTCARIHIWSCIRQLSRICSVRRTYMLGAMYVYVFPSALSRALRPRLWTCVSITTTFLLGEVGGVRFLFPSEVSTAGFVSCLMSGFGL
jgi:hypothetical protein